MPLFLGNNIRYPGEIRLTPFVRRELAVAFAILILALPLVNIVMYLYWALSSTGNINRKNFCIASLIWAAIGFGIFFVFLIFGGLIAALSGS